MMVHLNTICQLLETTSDFFLERRFQPFISQV